MNNTHAKELGFFKLVNHGVPMEFMPRLEDERAKFFCLPQSDKDLAGPPQPFATATRKIVPTVMWAGLNISSSPPIWIPFPDIRLHLPGKPENFRSAVTDYVLSVKNMAYEMPEMIAEGLNIQPRNVLSSLLRDATHASG